MWISRIGTEIFQHGRRGNNLLLRVVACNRAPSRLARVRFLSRPRVVVSIEYQGRVLEPHREILRVSRRCLLNSLAHYPLRVHVHKSRRRRCARDATDDDNYDNVTRRRQQHNDDTTRRRNDNQQYHRQRHATTNRCVQLTNVRVEWSYNCTAFQQRPNLHYIYSRGFRCNLL